MQAELKQVYRYCFGLLAILTFFLLILFLFQPYSKLEFFFQQLNAEKVNMLIWNDFTGIYGFSEKTYWVVIVGYFSIFLISTFSYLKLLNRNLSLKTSFIAPVIAISQKVKLVWQSLPDWEKWVIGLTWGLLILVRTYFLLFTRIGGDEAASYMFFVSKGIWGVLSYYSLPNNHVFSNLICLLIRDLFEEPYWVMQLPTFIISTLGIAVIYLAYRSVLPFFIIFFAATSFGFSQYALYFSVHGRGYFIISLCAAVAALAVYKIYERKEAYYWLLFLISSIIGFATVPVFLYPFAAIFTFGLLTFFSASNWKLFKGLIVAGFFVALITALFYSPILLVSGGVQLVGNQYVSSRAFESFYIHFPFFFTYTQGAVVGQETLGFYVWLIGFVGLIGLLIFKNRIRNWYTINGLKAALLFLVWCNICFPWIFILIQRVRPPERILVYKGFFDLLAIGIVLHWLSQYVQRRYANFFVFAFFLLVFSFSGYEVNKALRNEKNDSNIMDDGFDARLQTILKSGARTVYVNKKLYRGFLQYEFFKNGPRNYIVDGFKFTNSNNYEIVIIAKDLPLPEGFSDKGYQVIFQNSVVIIYGREAFLAKHPHMRVLK